MPKPKSIRVSRNVGLNPIAQAVFRREFQSQMIARKVRVLSIPHGEPCIEALEDVAFTLAVVGEAYEIQGLEEPTTNPEAVSAYNIIRGGLSAATQLAATNKWDVMQATAIVRALEAAENLLLGIRPINISKATILLTSPDRN